MPKYPWDDALAVTSLNWLSADPSETAICSEIGVAVESNKVADTFVRRWRPFVFASESFIGADTNDFFERLLRADAEHARRRICFDSPSGDLTSGRNRPSDFDDVATHSVQQLMEIDGRIFISDDKIPTSFRRLLRRHVDWRYPHRDIVRLARSPPRSAQASSMASSRLRRCGGRNTHESAGASSSSCARRTSPRRRGPPVDRRSAFCSASSCLTRCRL